MDVIRRDSIGFQIHSLDNLIDRRRGMMGYGKTDAQITKMHMWILGFLYMHRETDIFQKDVEAEFSITRSTVTNILQLMEKKGLIRRESVASDARLKKIVLTEKGESTHIQHIAGMNEFEEYLDGLITPAERAIFLEICAKLRAQLEE